MFLHLCFPAVNQTASAIPKTWRKPNEGISAGDAPQKEDEVIKKTANCAGRGNKGFKVLYIHCIEMCMKSIANSFKCYI